MAWAKQGNIAGPAGSVASAVVDVEGSGNTPIEYDLSTVYRITATADATISISAWPEAGVAASLELVAVGWGAHAVTLPESWNWGSAGVPSFPADGHARLILRSDDGGVTVDAMLAWSSA